MNAIEVLDQSWGVNSSSATFGVWFKLEFPVTMTASRVIWILLLIDEVMIPNPWSAVGGHLPSTIWGGGPSHHHHLCLTLTCQSNRVRVSTGFKLAIRGWFCMKELLRSLHLSSDGTLEWLRWAIRERWGFNMFIVNTQAFLASFPCKLSWFVFSFDHDLALLFWTFQNQTGHSNHGGRWKCGTALSSLTCNLFCKQDSGSPWYQD